MEVAIRESVAEATAQEGADVREALLHSKIDAVQRQLLVVLRLKKRNTCVLDALLKDHALQALRAQIEDAGCEILPDWGKGAVLLAPLTEEQVLEAEVKLRPHHIVVAQHDEARVKISVRIAGDSSDYLIESHHGMGLDVMHPDMYSFVFIAKDYDVFCDFVSVLCKHGAVLENNAVEFDLTGDNDEHAEKLLASLLARGIIGRGMI